MPDNFPPTQSAMSCDFSRTDGYHFIINRLVYPQGATIDGADFGPILITFRAAPRPLPVHQNVGGGNIAHFLNSTDNQSGNCTILSATMTFPLGTNITGFNKFNLSHVPCGTNTTTTT